MIDSTAFLFDLYYQEVLIISFPPMDNDVRINREFE